MANPTKCGKCGGPVKTLGNGKGTQCMKRVIRKVGGQWKEFGTCDWFVWNNAVRVQEEVLRSATFPKIAKPTDEQKAIRAHLSKSPKARGGRCTVVNAGPGTGKTTTMAWSLEGVYERLGTLAGYGVRAFNKVAANVMSNKTPLQVPDVSTLHSAGMRAQGYKGGQWGQVRLGKTYSVYNDLVSHIDPKERPGIGKLKTVLERSRNLTLYTEESDKPGWNEIISTTLARFPSIAKKVQGKGEEHLREYLPALAARTLANGKHCDFSDMITRPIMVAMQKTGWRMPCDLVLKTAEEWSDADVEHFAKLVRSIDLPSCSLVVDEAQDMDLAKIAVVLAQTWRTGELTIIGDDRDGTPGDEHYKAGQAIFGWLGAFGGSMALVARLWQALTGETAVQLALTITFRHGPEITEAYRPLNRVIKSALPAGQCEAWIVGPNAAFEAWLNLNADDTALWISRTNAALAPIFLNTLRNHEDCTIRGGEGFAGQVEDAVNEAADGDLNMDLQTTCNNLNRIIAEQSEEGGEKDGDNFTAFMLEMGESILADGTLLGKAKMQAAPLTAKTLLDFVLYFADKSSRRVLTTVYRCKGDEATLTVVADVAKFNESWGDSAEDNACRHVALSRAKRTLLTIGAVSGSDMQRKPENA